MAERKKKTMKNKNEFLTVLESAFKREALKKLILSRPKEGEIKKISCRLCAHRGRRLLAMEYSLPGNTVSHKNLGEDEFITEIETLLENYSQANLITTLGDAEWKRSKSGDKTVFLGGDALRRKLEGERPDFESAIEALDKKKNYILSGNEEFLKKLGVSSQDGRVHDKKQGKFRQINRFLEHIEDIYEKLPREGEIKIYDLCCGKSYLSFAVYYYLTEVKGRAVSLFGADLKRDVIIWCEGLAHELGFNGMTFEVGDISKLDYKGAPDMVISLHACDIATDIVLETAVKLGAKVILSTPCCHRHINDKISSPELDFVTGYPHLRNKLGDVLTDAIRVARLESYGYSVAALELVDPDDTPKNTLIKAIKKCDKNEAARARYEAILDFVLGDKKEDYLKNI